MTETELLAAVESGEMPLGVYADWLEERGDERAVGVRWLADHARKPTLGTMGDHADPIESAWMQGDDWRTFDDHLPLAVFNRLELGMAPWSEQGPGPPRVLLFGPYANAIRQAARAVATALEAGELE